MKGHPNPPEQTKVYKTFYPSGQIYECMIGDIAVMRRAHDSFVNATQILKVVGVEKGQRKRILDKEILTGVHETVVGGSRNYQGTWVPLEKGRKLATTHGVADVLAPLFDYAPVNRRTSTQLDSKPVKSASAGKPINDRSDRKIGDSEPSKKSRVRRQPYPTAETRALDKKNLAVVQIQARPQNLKERLEKSKNMSGEASGSNHVRDLTERELKLREDEIKLARGQLLKDLLDRGVLSKADVNKRLDLII